MRVALRFTWFAICGAAYEFAAISNLKYGSAPFKRTVWEIRDYYTIHLDEKLNVCDFNKGVSEAYTETLLKTIKIAEKLSVCVLNMHFNEGVYFTLPDKKVYLYNEYYEEYQKSLKAFQVDMGPPAGRSVA